MSESRLRRRVVPKLPSSSSNTTAATYFYPFIRDQLFFAVCVRDQNCSSEFCYRGGLLKSFNHQVSNTTIICDVEELQLGLSFTQIANITILLKFC